MQEVILKNNDSGLKVYINGVPNLKLIPNDIAESVVATLELQMSEYSTKASLS
jgi:hypothetical protein